MAKEPAHVQAQRLCIAAKAGDKKAMLELLAMCASVLASKTMDIAFDEDERTQLARITVWRAVLRYESGTGASFMSYLVYYGVQHLRRALIIQLAGIGRVEAARKGLKAQGISEEAPDDTEQSAMWAEVDSAIDAATELLTVRQVRVMLGTLRGLSQYELAAEEGVSHTTVQNDTRAALHCLRRLLGVGAVQPGRRDRSDMVRWRDSNRSIENERRRARYAQKKAKNQ